MIITISEEEVAKVLCDHVRTKLGITNKLNWKLFANYESIDKELVEGFTMEIEVPNKVTRKQQ